MTQIKTDLHNLVKSGKGILIGSRGLGVHTSISDTDIALLWSDLPKSLSESKILDIRQYFNFLPMHNSGLIKLYNIDILLFTHPDDMSIVAKAKADVKLVPKYMLEHKQTRIDLFERALNHYGWVTPSSDEVTTPTPVVELNLGDIPLHYSCGR